MVRRTGYALVGMPCLQKGLRRQVAEGERRAGTTIACVTADGHQDVYRKRKQSRRPHEFAARRSACRGEGDAKPDLGPKV